MQEPVDAFAEHEDVFEEPGDKGFLVSSQESGVSSVSANEGVGNPRKRLFVHGQEDEVEDYEGDVEEPVVFPGGEEMATRVYARPRTRRIRALDGDVSSSSFGDVAQESTFDWEEADFLEPRDTEMEGT